VPLVPETASPGLTLGGLELLARIGANAVVLTEVPPGVTMVGIPARMVLRKPKEGEPTFCAYGLADENLPDPVARAVDSLRAQVNALLERVEELEGELQGTKGKNGASRRKPRVIAAQSGEDDGESLSATSQQ